MSILQKLYENGYITYMRTDSSCYSKDFITSLKKHIEQNYGEQYLLPTIEQLSINKSKGKAGADWTNAEAGAKAKMDVRVIRNKTV